LKRNGTTHIYCLSIFTINNIISLTGLAYFLLERLNTESDERQLEKEPLTAIFLSSITFTNHFEFKPQTHPARLLSFSWTLWALIIASAYTGTCGGCRRTRETTVLVFTFRCSCLLKVSLYMVKCTHIRISSSKSCVFPCIAQSGGVFGQHFGGCAQEQHTGLRAALLGHG